MSQLSRVNSIEEFLTRHGSRQFSIDELINITPPFTLIVSDWVQKKFKEKEYSVLPDVIRVCGEVRSSPLIYTDHRRLLRNNGELKMNRGDNIHLQHRGHMELYRFRDGLEWFENRRSDVWREWQFKLPLLYADAPEAFVSVPRLNTAYK